MQLLLWAVYYLLTVVEWLHPGSQVVARLKNLLCHLLPSSSSSCSRAPGALCKSLINKKVSTYVKLSLHGADWSDANSCCCTVTVAWAVEQVGMTTASRVISQCTPTGTQTMDVAGGMSAERGPALGAGAVREDTTATAASALGAHLHVRSAAQHGCYQTCSLHAAQLCLRHHTLRCRSYSSTKAPSSAREPHWQVGLQ